MIAAGLSLSLPVYTYGVVTGLSIFFLGLSSPFVREGEKMDSTVLLAINAIVGGVNGTVQYCIASAFAVNTFGWFGGKVPLWLLIIMGVLGFILMAIFSVSGNVMVASWFRPKDAVADTDADTDGAESKNSAGSAGCVYAILSWVNLVVYLAFFIVLFRFLGWGGLFAYIGVSTGLLVALVIISTIVELLPTLVLVIAAIVITVAFEVARGYPSILALFKL